MITKSKMCKAMNRIMAFALAVIMAVPNLSMGSVNAAADDGWAASATKPGYLEKTTTYDFTSTDTVMPAGITAVQGKVAKKSGYLSIQKDAKTEAGKNGVITIALDAATTDVDFSFTLTSNNTKRSIIVGAGTTETVSLDTKVTPGIDSTKSYSNSYGSAYLKDAVLRLEGITTDPTDSAEIKFGSITVKEYKSSNVQIPETVKVTPTITGDLKGNKVYLVSGEESVEVVSGTALTLPSQTLYNVVVKTAEGTVAEGIAATVKDATSFNSGIADSEITIVVATTVLTVTPVVTGDDLGTNKLVISDGEKETELTNGVAVVLPKETTYTLSVKDSAGNALENWLAKVEGKDSFTTASDETQTLNVTITFVNEVKITVGVADAGKLLADGQKVYLVNGDEKFAVDGDELSLTPNTTYTVAVFDAQGNAVTEGIEVTINGKSTYTTGTATEAISVTVSTKSTGTTVYDFRSNAGKAAPVLGGVLAGTDTETSGILYKDKGTSSGCSFDSNQLRFRNGVELWIPVKDDTTKITYAQTGNGNNAGRPTYVLSKTSGYELPYDKVERSVTIDDITDYIKEENGQKYVAIYSGGDVKLLEIKVTEYNPINAVTVSGTVEGAAAAGVKAITFKNMDDADAAPVTVNVAADGSYTATLKRVGGKTNYAAVVAALGYAVDDTNGGDRFTLTGNGATATQNFKLKEVPVANISGKITGIPASAVKGTLGVELVPDNTALSNTVLTLTANADGTYSYASVAVDVNREYTVKLTNADDYEVNTVVRITTEGASTKDIAATAKPVVTVSGNFVTNNDGTADVTKITFTNMDNAAYSYTFDVTGTSYTAQLREAEYVTSVESANYTAYDHVSVKKSAVTNDVYLEGAVDTSAVAYKETVQVGAGKEFATITDALAYVSRMTRTEDQRVTIELTAGEVYREQLVVETPNVTIKGNGATITWYYGVGFSYYSAKLDKDATNRDVAYYDEAYAVDKYVMQTISQNPGHWGATVNLTAQAKGFAAENVVFENSLNRYLTTEELADGAAENVAAAVTNRTKANIDVRTKAAKERACALYNQADNVEFKDCKFLSSQDTLYTGDGMENSYFVNCVIEGTTDYICGDGNPVFDACTLSMYSYSDQEAKGSYIAASKGTGSHGYLFNNCKIVTTTDAGLQATSANILCRAWGAGTVHFLNTEVESAGMIDAVGYKDMNSKVTDAHYYEYNTHTPEGTAVDTTGRAEGVTIMTQAEAEAVEITDFFDKWKPSYYTGKYPEGYDGPTGSETVISKKYTFEATTLTATADKEAIEEGTKFADGYFVVADAAISKRTDKKTGDVVAVELTKKMGSAFSFTVTGTADVVIEMGSTGSANTSEVALVDAEGKTVANEEGLESVTGTERTALTYKNLEAGTYKIVATDGSRGARLYSVNVDDKQPAMAVKSEYTFEATTLTAAADKEAIVAGTKFAEGYFVVADGAISKRTDKKTGDVVAVELTKKMGSAFSFTVTGTADVVIEMGSTGSANTSEVALVDAEGKKVANEEGLESVTGTEKTALTYKNLEAGTYKIVATDGSRGARLYSVTVSESKLVPVVTETNFFDATTLTATADKEAIVAGTKFAEGYFVVADGAISKRTDKKTGDVVAVELTKKMGSAFSFTVTGTADVVIEMGSTGSANTSEVALVDAEGKKVANEEGLESVTGTERTTLTYKGLTAGTYKIVATDGGRGARLYTAKVVETKAAEENKERADWSGVAAPVVKSVALDAANAGKINVTVEALVGYNGGDKLTLNVINAATNEIVETMSSIVEDTSFDFTFTPEASGTYKFGALLTREGEETAKVTAKAESIDFVLPLGTPSVSSVTCLGGGKASVVWAAVKEAEKYVVSVDGTSISKEVATNSATIEGLTVGQTYTFRVVAIRGQEESAASTMSWKITDSAQRTWSFAAFGQGVTASSNKATGSLYEGNLKIYSTGGKGKLVPASTDGLAFYYTAIDPETENFTLSADITVDEWTLSNGQEGFGMMAADAVGTHGDSSVFWNNSYMATITKVEYKWDKNTNSVSDTGDKYSMYLGVGAQEKIGATPENIAAGNPINDGFTSTMWPLDLSAVRSELGAGSYGIVGNSTNPDAVAQKGTLLTPLKTTFHLEIQRNNTGYFLTYTDGNGNSRTQKFYHGANGDALTQIDKDNIYVGFYASRNAVISVDNVSLTTINPADDTPAEGRPITYVTPVYTIESGKVANSADHELVFYANADGTLRIEDLEGNVLLDDKAVTATVKERLNVKLDAGVNNFKVTFRPDPDYVPGEYSELSSYDSVTIYHKVTYEVNVGDVIYVSPNANGVGTKEDPMSIRTALVNAAPGQKIYMMEGTYKLSKTLKIERGIDGTATQPIYLMADPEATTRPVIDGNGICAAMVVAGDYWYLQGFDVTNSAAGQKGLQISGSNNTVDNIRAYRNGNTGIQISRYLSTDTWEDWPSNNLILNCTSYLNADPGYEDADGFAAKLTIADGNVFDGCIAAYNADDGWDLFAKIESGPIGSVTIKNCLAFKNGYDIDADGNEINAGNGNGFKMGGSSISGYHVLENSIAFANKAKGIDSNSCPDIQVKNSISFNNGSYNVAFYTNDAANTDFAATGIISYKDANGNTEGENFKFKGTQDESKVKNETNYFFPDGNTNGVKAADNWFVSLDTDAAIHGGITRNADGTINMNGYLELTDKAQSGAGADMSNGTPSTEVDTRDAFEIIADAIEDVQNATNIGEVEAALEDVRNLPESTWEGKLYYDPIFKELGKLSAAVAEKAQTTLTISNQATVELLEAVNAILSIPAGQNGTLIVEKADVPADYLPASFDDVDRVSTEIGLKVTLTNNDGTPVSLKAPVVLEFARPSYLNKYKPTYVFCYAEDGSVKAYRAIVDEDTIKVAVTELGRMVIATLTYDEAPSETPGAGVVGGGAGSIVNPTKPAGKVDNGKTSPVTDTLGKADDKAPESIGADKTPADSADQNAATNDTADNNTAEDDGVLATPSNRANWMLMFTGVAAALFVLLLFFYKKQEGEE